jgi:hypothetical protein
MFEKTIKENAKDVKNDQILSTASSKINDLSKDDPVDKVDMARFVLLSIVIIFPLHGVFLIYSSIFGLPAIHSIKDTLNGAFACNAVCQPLVALSIKLQLILSNRLQDVISYFGGVRKTAKNGTLVLSSGIEVLSVVYFLYALAAVHGVSIWSMVWPFLSFVILSAPFYGLWIWLRSIGRARRES